MIFSRMAVALLLATAALAGCATRSVTLIHPQSGATARCGAAGVGIMAGSTESMVAECLKSYESQGYVTVENLTPDQRADLEKRDLLPKSEPPTFKYGN